MFDRLKSAKSDMDVRWQMVNSSYEDVRERIGHDAKAKVKGNWEQEKRIIWPQLWVTSSFMSAGLGAAGIFLSYMNDFEVPRINLIIYSVILLYGLISIRPSIKYRARKYEERELAEFQYDLHPDTIEKLRKKQGKTPLLRRAFTIPKKPDFDLSDVEEAERQMSGPREFTYDDRETSGRDDDDGPYTVDLQGFRL